ncbi:hypothetical protein GCM10010433_32440 [Streptomyces pulveraceus]
MAVDRQPPVASPPLKGPMRMGKMHADEPDTDESLVHRLIASQFPDWAGLPVAPVTPVGTSNAMYRLGEDLAVRLPRTAGAAADVEKEQRWLPRLGPVFKLRSHGRRQFEDRA